MAFADGMINLKAIFTSLIEALELSDPYTRGHSERVGSLAVALGIELGLSVRELEILKDSGALHDIGKLGISKEILNKPGKLTSEEFDQIKSHVLFGYNILKPLDQPELLEITLLHHERIDGKGYPYGREDYPLLVRIVQIADVWDALTSSRPYRDAMPYAKARSLMGADDNPFGFDTELTETFLRLTRFTFPDADCDPKEMDRIFQEISKVSPGNELDKKLTSA